MKSNKATITCVRNNTIKHLTGYIIANTKTAITLLAINGCKTIDIDKASIKAVQARR